MYIASVVTDACFNARSNECPAQMPGLLHRRGSFITIIITIIIIIIIINIIIITIIITIIIIIIISSSHSSSSITIIIFIIISSSSSSPFRAIPLFALADSHLPALFAARSHVGTMIVNIIIISTMINTITLIIIIIIMITVINSNIIIIIIIIIISSSSSSNSSRSSIVNEQGGTTCLTLLVNTASFVLCVVHRVADQKYHHNFDLLHDSPLSKKTGVGQVVPPECRYENSARQAHYYRYYH